LNLSTKIQHFSAKCKETANYFLRADLKTHAQPLLCWFCHVSQALCCHIVSVFLFFHDNYYKDESSVLRSVLLFLQNTDNRLHRREISNIHAMTAAGIGDDFFLRTDGFFLVGGEKNLR